MGLEALAEGKLTEATQEERDLIEGQLYFMRGWFYFQLTQYWGGLPYIDTVLPSDEPLTLPRESYRENAEKMAADFQRAANLLPIDWEETTVGRNTRGNNELRPNKIWALSMLGKTYLYAEVPNGQWRQRATNLRRRDVQKGADAFGQLLSMVENGRRNTRWLTSRDYSSLLHHSARVVNAGWHGSNHPFPNIRCRFILASNELIPTFGHVRGRRYRSHALGELRELLRDGQRHAAGRPESGFDPVSLEGPRPRFTTASFMMV